MPEQELNQTSTPARGSSARSALGIFGTNIAIYPLTLIVGLIVARVLGPSDRGVLTFLRLMGFFVLPLCSFGFGAAVRYFVSVGDYRVGDVVVTVAVISASFGLMVSLAIAGLWSNGWLGVTASQISPSLMLPVLASLPFTSVSGNLSMVLLGASDFGFLNGVNFGRMLVSTVLMAVLVLVLGLGIDGAVATVVILPLMTVIAMSFFIWRRYRPRWTFNREFVRGSFQYGIRAWVGSLATTAMARGDQFVVGFFGSAPALGNYSIAVLVSELAVKVPDAVTPVLFNRIASLRDENGRIRLTEQCHRVLFGFTFSTGLLIMISAPVAIPLILGEAYQDAVLPLLIYIPGVIIFTPQKVLSKFFGATGKPTYGSLVQTVATAVGLPLYVFGAVTYGSVGVAAANTAAACVAAVVAIRLYRHLITPVRSHLFSFSRHDLLWGRDQLWAAVPGLVRWFRYRG